MEYRVISADDHIDMPWLPRDLWQKRVPPQWRERAPRVVDTADGPYWVCGEDRWDPWGGRKGAAGALGGRRSALERGGVLEPGVLRPTTTALRLEDMARDGIDATVMYGPIVPLLIKDPQLRQNEMVVPLEGAGGHLTLTVSSPIQVHDVTKVPAKRACRQPKSRPPKAPESLLHRFPRAPRLQGGFQALPA